MNYKHLITFTSDEQLTAEEQYEAVIRIMEQRLQNEEECFTIKDAINNLTTKHESNCFTMA